MTVGLTALVLLMAVIRANVFTMLTCMYLNDAMQPGHREGCKRLSGQRS